MSLIQWLKDVFGNQRKHKSRKNIKHFNWDKKDAVDAYEWRNQYPNTKRDE